MKKTQKTMLGFLYINYRKFCSILLENLVVSNPHISEEWDDNKIFQKNFFGNFLIIIFMSHFWWILIYQCHIVVDNASLQKKVISDDEFLITCWRFFMSFFFLPLLVHIVFFSLYKNFFFREMTKRFDNQCKPLFFQFPFRFLLSCLVI